MRSLLYQDGATPFIAPSLCGPCRNEITTTIKFNGRLYTVTIRDKIGPEDPYLVLIKAAAFAIQNGEPYAGTTTSRAVRDFLIRDNVVV